MARAAAAGSSAERTGLPTTRCVAPSATASAGVATRFWSPTAAPAGRTPGVTNSVPAGRDLERSPTSFGEQTRPCAPLAVANCAMALTWSAGVLPVIPTSARSDSSREVSTVTASMRGLSAPNSAAASAAARIMALPPTECIVMRSTPRRPADLTERSTVRGMSWSLRSRNTFLPRSFTALTTSGPSAVNSSSPIL